MRVIIDISDDAYKRISDVNTELSYEDAQLVKYAICLGESLYDYEKRKSVPDNSGWSLPKNFHEMSEERQRGYLGIFG